jgi:hypothetical protein
MAVSEARSTSFQRRKSNENSKRTFGDPPTCKEEEDSIGFGNKWKNTELKLMN